MFRDDLYVAESTMFQRVEERVQEARDRSLARQVDGRRQGALGRLYSRSICQLSGLLAAVGQRPGQPRLSVCEEI